MSEEQAIEAIAREFALAAGWTFHDVRTMDPGPRAREKATTILAALRDAGFDIYRPEDCEKVTVELGADVWITPSEGCYFDAGTYRLVPVVPKGEG